MTFEPGRAVMRSLAMPSVFSTLRPTIQAFAPRWTSARTWAEQMVPLPPVQKTTLLSILRISGMWGGEGDCLKGRTEDAISPDVA